MHRSQSEKSTYSIITGSGSYLPTRIIKNSDFLSHTFFDDSGNKLQQSNEEVIRKLTEITGIVERRYVTHDLVASDIAFFAAEAALSDAGMDREQLDYIIVAHNFGDICENNRRSDLVPALASRVKFRLGIKNSQTVCYDLPSGCAGWLQAVIQADLYIRCGEAKKVLVIGAETLSRVTDIHDRNCMLFADGAGAVVVEAYESSVPVGILSHTCRSYTDQATVLRMGKSNYINHHSPEQLVLKMQGRILYEHALTAVPAVIKETMDKAGLGIKDMKMLLIHQANKKMDDAILKRVYQEFNMQNVPENKMPLTVETLGNSSVATLPTLYDLTCKEHLPGYKIKGGDSLVFASMGAGINVNAIVYRVPG